MRCASAVLQGNLGSERLHPSHAALQMEKRESLAFTGPLFQCLLEKGTTALEATTAACKQKGLGNTKCQ